MLKRGIASLVVPLVWFAGSAAGASGQDFDILIRNGRILDGTGNPDIRADIGIRGDRIAAIGRLDGSSARRTIDAEGLFVAPGFIDLHSHADRLLVSDEPEARRAHNLVTQGITTVIGAPDGTNVTWPIDAEKATYRSPGIGMNMVPMIGHSSVRRSVMGDDYARPATQDEVGRMQALVREAMDGGAWGLSAGLEGRIARFSAPSELIELARVVADYDGFYIVHQRNESAFPMWYLPGITEIPPLDGHGALRETIEVARATGIRVVATHIKASGRPSWGRSVSDIEVMTRARAEGLQVYADQYPYTHGGGAARIMVPNWAFAPLGTDRTGGQDDPRLGGAAVFREHRENLRRNLADPATRARIERDVEYLIDYWAGAENQIVVAHPDPSMVGRTLAELAASRGERPVETVLHYALNPYVDEPGGGLSLRRHSMNEFDIENYMAQDWTAMASDASIIDVPGSPSQPGSAPRNYGAFVRKIAEYARDRGVISLPFAIRSATGLPAQIIGLRDRGYLREGYKADIVVFDYDALRDHATVTEPDRYSEGIEYLLINGTLSIDGRRITDALPGVVIERDGVPSGRLQTMSGRRNAPGGNASATHADHRLTNKEETCCGYRF